MKVVIKSFNDIRLVVPVGFEFPFDTVDSCPFCCGPSLWGLGKLVPDKMCGLKINACCYIHDVCFEVADPTWADFRQSNTMFLVNLTLIRAKSSRFSTINVIRRCMVSIYYNTTVLFGASIFWRLKRKQGKIRS